MNCALNPYFGVGTGAAPLERLIVSGGEHLCVLSGHRFPASAVEIAPLAADGRIDLTGWPQPFESRVARFWLFRAQTTRPASSSPSREAAALVHAAGGFVFCDAVQLAGRADCDIGSLGADALALSAHKMGGPKGAGALVAARPGFSLGEPLIRGGGQERGARGGHRKCAAIAGFGAAARACLAELQEEAERLLPSAIGWPTPSGTPRPDAVVFGEAAPRLPNTVCFAVPGVEAATLMIALDLAGVAVSSGSACSSGKVTPSHVLAAMGVRAGTGARRNPAQPRLGVDRRRRRPLRRRFRRPIARMTAGRERFAR